jgi:hypothetical protein
MASAASCGSCLPREIGRGWSRYRSAWLLTCLFVSCWSAAQELEPRAYSPNPVGSNFLVLDSARSTGSLLFDPSLPLSNVDAHLNRAVIAYGRTFGLADHVASALLSVPYVWGSISGNVGEGLHDIHRSGLADARLRLSVNLIGGPALTPAQFALRTPQTTVGASLTIVAPVGQYDSMKLINIGSNRWGFKPEIGISWPLSRWDLEAYAGVWLFTDNADYYGGVRREQDPIGTVQGHISYTLRPRLWLAFDTTYYTGGRTTVNAMRNADLQANSRVGLTLSVPAGTRQSVKFSWSDSATTRSGGSFRTFGIAWQYAWFD